MPAMPSMVTVPEVATTLRVGPATVYRWCRHRELESVRVAGTVRISAAALEREAATRQRWRQLKADTGR